MGVAQEIKALMNKYQEVSVNHVKLLCDYVGVKYRDPKDAPLLQADMKEKGYQLLVQKFTDEGEAVGQFISLLDLDRNIIRKYAIFIDFDDFEIKTNELASEVQ